MLFYSYSFSKHLHCSFHRLEGLNLSSQLVSWLSELMAGCLVSEVTDRLTGRVVARPWLNGDKLTQTVKLAD